MEADAWFGPADEVTPPGAEPPTAAAGPTDLGDLPELVVTWAGRLAGTRDALLYLVEPAGRRLVARSGSGRFAAGVGGGVGGGVGKGEGLAGEVWRAGMPLVAAGHASAELAMPLLREGAVVGVLRVASGEPGRTFDHGDVERLRGVGELAGAAIGNATRPAGTGGEAEGQPQTEDWLPPAEARYRALFEQVPAVVYSEVHGSGGVMLYQSPQIYRMLGYTPEESMRPGHWMARVHPDDRDRVAAENERCDRTGDPWGAEYRVIAKDGRVVWIRDHAVLVPGEGGEPDCWQGFYIDVTEQKLAEAATHEALDRERQAAVELRAVDTMKNTFLDAVSHELRTPLAAVIGIAKTLRRAGSSLDEEDTADLVDRLVNNADKLDRLLTDLLDLDRLSKGIVAPKLDRTDLAALVDRVAKEWRQGSGRRLDVVAEPVVARVDAAKVERIVENLLVNADRHTTPETPVWVRVARHDGAVLLAVEDAGAGVPHELQAELFEPFRRGPEASTQAPGAGIGLALVSRFAQLHGGRAWVQDRPGGGASFRVLLPDPAEP
jgi:PAS domain S-box-containing protein